VPEEKASQNLDRQPNAEASIKPPNEPPRNQDPPPQAADRDSNQDRCSAQKLEKDIKTGEYWLIGIGIVTILVNIVIGAIYYGQLQQMIAVTKATQTAVNVSRDTLAETQRSNKAQEVLNKTTLQSAIDNFHLDQRPWVVLKPSACKYCKAEWKDSLINVSLGIVKGVVVNTGKTPAEHVEVDFVIHSGAVFPYIAHPGDNVVWKFEDHPEKGHPVKIGVIAPGQENTAIFTRIDWERDVRLTKAGGGHPSVYIDGTMTYQSAWGEKGETKFCFFPIDTTSNPQFVDFYYNCDAPERNTMR
jgi:hypothetical protein